MNICGTDKDPMGVTCAPGYAQFAAARAADTRAESGSPQTGNNNLWVFALIVAAAWIVTRRD